MDHTKSPYQSEEHPTYSILGLGNPIVSDDAVGLHTITLLENLLPAKLRGWVSLQTCTRGGFELLDLLIGYNGVVLIDCLDVPDPEPGRIRRLSLEDVSGSSRLVGGHELSVGQAFAMANRIGLTVPHQVAILGIEGEDLLTFAEQLSPAVAKASRQAADEALVIVREWIGGA